MIKFVKNLQKIRKWKLNSWTNGILFQHRSPSRISIPNKLDFIILMNVFLTKKIIDTIATIQNQSVEPMDLNNYFLCTHHLHWCSTLQMNEWTSLYGAKTIKALSLHLSSILYLSSHYIIIQYCNEYCKWVCRRHFDCSHQEIHQIHSNIIFIKHWCLGKLLSNHTIIEYMILLELMPRAFAYYLLWLYIFILSSIDIIQTFIIISIFTIIFHIFC